VATYQEIERNPKFLELVRRRKSLGWTLSILMLAIYLGFILVVSFAPSILSLKIGWGVMTWGPVIGVLVILSAFLLTGIYVRKANSAYDTLTRAIVEESK
jgi:uncharacterized membrane protein (DUF485 family)